MADDRPTADIASPLELEVWFGDITTLGVDAIVNAANDQLRAGGGVCGAIHAAAGSELAAACNDLGGCDVGDAKATDGFDLPARWVIHAVGPIWRGGTNGEVELLASTYRRSIEVADELGARSIAFPAISTGIYGFPLDLATETAVAALAALGTVNVRRCVLVGFDEETFVLLDQTVGRLT